MKVLDRRHEPETRRPLIELQPGDLYQVWGVVLMKLKAQGPDIYTEWGVCLETGDVAKFDSQCLVIPLAGYLVVEGVLK